MWWLEYPSILKDYREKNLDSLKKRLKSITTAPLKFEIIFLYMKKVLYFINFFKKIKKFFTIIILFKNIKKLKSLSLQNQKYNKIDKKKDLLILKFDNFKIPIEFFERIKNNYELHYLYQNKNLLKKKNF